MASLKNEIIGSWKLLSYIEVPVGGGESLFPLGKSPKGNLIYSPDGYMSVQISASEDLGFSSDDRILVSQEELLKRLQRYIAFSGRYTVDNEMACVIYLVENSLYPAWENTRQVRKLDFEGDVLYQKSLDPIKSGGKLVHAYMTWKKVEKSNYDEQRISDQEMEFS